MQELIDRDTALKLAYHNYYPSIDHLCCSVKCATYDELKALPTIEAEPVRHGRWIFDEYTAKYGHPYKCSECKEESRDTYDYCPCCGARMDLRTPTDVQLDEADSVMMGGADNGNG